MPLFFYLWQWPLAHGLAVLSAAAGKEIGYYSMNPPAIFSRAAECRLRPPDRLSVLGGRSCRVDPDVPVVHARQGEQSSLVAEVSLSHAHLDLVGARHVSHIEIVRGDITTLDVDAIVTRPMPRCSVVVAWMARFIARPAPSYWPRAGPCRSVLRCPMPTR